MSLLALASLSGMGSLVAFVGLMAIVVIVDRLFLRLAMDEE